MAMLKDVNLTIRTFGDPCLRKKSKPIKEIGPSEGIFIDILTKTMCEKDGVGLAAPQVGVNKRIFIADMGEGPMVVVNPKILKKSNPTFLEEGCLSVPGIVVNVQRPDNITVEYIDHTNRCVKREYSGLMAKIFQHENDHLDGKLIIDYAKGKEKEEVEQKLKTLEQENQID